MVMKYFGIAVITLGFLSFLYGCGSSTASRYAEERGREEIEVEDLSEEESLPFDMTPYHSRFEFNIPSDDYKGEIWYSYEETQDANEEVSLIDTEGFRVEVLATDNLEDANNMRSELRFRIKQNVYIIFDPPFYRVRTGDYESRSAAENQNFKLRQLGYQESRVVSDIIKIPDRP
jgi:hypothetical protein